MGIAKGKKRKASIYDYTHICYMDASGNEGQVYDVPNGGSSTCFTAAYFLATPADLPYNTDKLSEIKELVGCKPEDELKYKTLKRHRRLNDVLKLIMSMRGRAGSITWFKKLELSAGDNYGMDMISAVHTLLISLMLTDIDTKVLVVIDRMKEIEMESVYKYLLGTKATSLDLLKNCDVIFRDSKDRVFPFIQIADILAGLTRQYFEKSITCEHHKTYARLCKACGWNRFLCRKEKTHKPYILGTPLFRVIDLFNSKTINPYRRKYRKVIGGIPLSLIKSNYRYFTCLK
jgi:hypothetical protein